MLSLSCYYYILHLYILYKSEFVTNMHKLFLVFAYMLEYKIKISKFLKVMENIGDDLLLFLQNNLFAATWKKNDG